MPLPGYNIDPPGQDWHTVQFRDLRFATPPGSGKAPPLSGWVYIGPGEEIEAMVLSGREQK